MDEVSLRCVKDDVKAFNSIAVSVEMPDLFTKLTNRRRWRASVFALARKDAPTRGRSIFC
jgi:hypothetical protein